MRRHSFKHQSNSKNDGVLSIDNSLLKHYGKHFDNIYYHYDYVYKCYRWAHDLVTLHYSDDKTDYPVFYKLWDISDWEAVANFLREKGHTINEEKWSNRKIEPQKWRNYIRSGYRAGRKKFPAVTQVYKTKLHIAEDLLRKFDSKYKNLSFPVALDSGFTSAELCEIIVDDLKRDYVGSLREDQMITQNNEEKTLQTLVQQLREEHHNPTQTKITKTGFTYKGEKQMAYTYTLNLRVRGFKNKQRLVISFLNKDLKDRPNFTISNRLDWYPTNILRIRRHRWPVETYHQEGKAEGLECYQVRGKKAIQTYLALIIVIYSMLKCTLHDAELLAKLQQRLQMETDGTLPFLRRLMNAKAIARKVNLEKLPNNILGRHTLISF